MDDLYLELLIDGSIEIYEQLLAPHDTSFIYEAGQIAISILADAHLQLVETMVR